MDVVKIVFERQTPYGLYRDALYFPADQVPPDDMVERLKQDRVDNWLMLIAAPPVEEAPQDG
jgi:hypothetical protein